MIPSTVNFLNKSYNQHIMKRLIIIFLAMMIILSGCNSNIYSKEKIGNQRAAPFDPVDCPDIKRVDYEKSYTGSLIDTHIHIAPIPDGPIDEKTDRPTMGVNIKIADYVCMMDVEGTSKVFAFFPVWDPIPEMIDVVNRTLEKYPGRFVPFIMPPDHDDRLNGFPTVDADKLSEMLKVNPGLFDGYGEIGLYARGDHGGPKGALALLPDSKRMLEIYPIIRENNLLVYVHLGEGQKESFEKVIDANPDINFIWHGDQLVKIRSDGTEDLADIEEILYAHSNVYYGVDELYGGIWLIRPEVSKEEFLSHFKDYEPLLKKDIDQWKGFIERHPDQVLWGTDRGWSSPWSVDPEVAITLNRYSRAFIGRLNPDVQEKFAYKNAERLINYSGRK